MKIVEFYRGERGNHEGRTLEEIMKYSLEDMELDHSYIQWLLPSNEPSKMNGDAPVLTKEEAIIFQSDPELHEKIKQSFLKFIDFLGLQLVEDGEVQIITDLPPTYDRYDPLWWMSHFNHNHLRVTRCLKCMRLTGHEKYALALFRFLEKNRYLVSYSHWSKAAMDDLW